MQDKHHIYGPSALDSLSRCPRFKFRSMDDGSADEGTDLHAAFETGDLTGLGSEEAQAITAMRSYVESLKYEDGTKPEDWIDEPELKVELEGLTYGRADRIIYCLKTGHVHVIDAKFTRVESAHDMQLRTYGAAFVERQLDKFKTVTTHVLAPRLQKVESHDYVAALLVEEMRAQITELYSRVENPFTPPTPHEESCGRCQWAASCPALGHEVAVAAKGLGLPMPKDFAPGGNVSPRDRAIAQTLRGIFNNWGDLVAKNNAEFVDQGGTVPGFRLTHRSTGLRVPKDQTHEAITALMSLGIPESVIISCCNLVVGDANNAAAFVLGMPVNTAKEAVRTALTGIAGEGSCMFLQKERRISDELLLDEIIR